MANRHRMHLHEPHLHQRCSAMYTRKEIRRRLNSSLAKVSYHSCYLCNKSVHPDEDQPSKQHHGYDDNGLHPFTRLLPFRRCVLQVSPYKPVSFQEKMLDFFIFDRTSLLGSGNICFFVCMSPVQTLQHVCQPSANSIRRDRLVRKKS